MSVLRDGLGWTNPSSGWLSSISLDLFALVWAAALIIWRRNSRASRALG